jgi:N-acetylglucosamine-6-sulfatase
MITRSTTTAPSSYESTSADYETDVIANHAKTFIGTSAKAGVPFFAYVAPYAPHFPATPAPRDLHTYDGFKARRPPSFNEKDVSDNLSWIRQLPRLSDAKKAKIDNQHERRAESLQAVDDLVAGVVGTLKDKGVLSSTYIFFTSDNGWHEGEHRIQQGKWRPYEEDIHMPLVVRGPGVAAGSTTYKLVLNTDYLPTFTDLAGEQIPYYVDGRSLKPVLDESVTSWRSAILLEAAANYSQAYRGIRTVTNNTITRRKYVEYAGGARELYNLETDGYELTNSYDATAPPTSLAMRLQALKVCAAYSCRTAEDGS